MKTMNAALVVIFLISCQIVERKRPSDIPASDATFENAVVYYRKGQHEKSFASIEAYLLAYPQTTKLVESLYLRGRNERFLAKYVNCLETFQNIIELTKNKKDSYFNYALYQSGICYEMLGDIEKAIAVYQDALRATGSLPAQLRDLEIPSRLALCYSRLGEKQAAEKYNKKLQISLKEYLSKKQFTKEEKEFYAEILFSMSSLEIPLKDQQDFDAVLTSLEMNQVTLIQLLKFNIQPYTLKALNIYVQNYTNLHEYLVQLRINEGIDPTLSNRGKQQIQKEMAFKVLENIESLEVLLLPEAMQPDLSAEFEKLKEIKGKFELMSVQRMSGDGLTPDAQRRESLKKEGKVIDKPTVLEEKSQQEKK